MTQSDSSARPLERRWTGKGGQAPDPLGDRGVPWHQQFGADSLDLLEMYWL